MAQARESKNVAGAARKSGTKKKTGGGGGGSNAIPAVAAPGNPGMTKGMVLISSIDVAFVNLNVLYSH